MKSSQRQTVILYFCIFPWPWEVDGYVVLLIVKVGFTSVSVEHFHIHCKYIKWGKKVFQLNCSLLFLQMAKNDQVILGITWIMHKSNLVMPINFDTGWKWQYSLSFEWFSITTCTASLVTINNLKNVIVMRMLTISFNWKCHLSNLQSSILKLLVRDLSGSWNLNRIPDFKNSLKGDRYSLSLFLWNPLHI